MRKHSPHTKRKPNREKERKKERRKIRERSTMRWGGGKGRVGEREGSINQPTEA
jgi:hypothetical protein